MPGFYYSWPWPLAACCFQLHSIFKKKDSAHFFTLSFLTSVFKLLHNLPLVWYIFEKTSFLISFFSLFFFFNFCFSFLKTSGSAPAKVGFPIQISLLFFCLQTLTSSIMWNSITYPNHRENTFLEMVCFSLLYLLFSKSKIFIYCYQLKLLVVKSWEKRWYFHWYRINVQRCQLYTEGCRTT